MIMEHLELLHYGSVKEVYKFKEDNKHLYFFFSDHYSIFDWGKMPDKIPQKGNSLLSMANSFFKLLKINNISHHSKGIVEIDNKKLLKVDKFFVPQIEFNKKERKYSYRRYHQSVLSPSIKKIVLPLEVIFRFGVPNGSSFLKRNPNIKTNSYFKEPIIEFTTKWEEVDRFIDKEDVLKISLLDENLYYKLIENIKKIANILRVFFLKIDMKLWDGKLEFGWDINNHKDPFILIDSIGLDEIRLSSLTDINSNKYSKEFLRDHYRKSDWFKKMQSKKNNDTKNFKKLCIKDNIIPHKLPIEIVKTIQNEYNKLSLKIEKAIYF